MPSLIPKQRATLALTLQSYCLARPDVKKNRPKVCKTPIILPKKVVIWAPILIFYHKTLDKPYSDVLSLQPNKMKTTSLLFYRPAAEKLNKIINKIIHAFLFKF